MDRTTERHRTNLDAVLNPDTKSVFNQLPNLVFEDNIVDRKDFFDETRLGTDSAPGL